MLLARFLGSFQSLPPLITSKLSPSGAESWVGGFVHLLAPCGSLQQTLLWGWEFLPPPLLPQVFSVSGIEASFPHTVTLGCVFYLISQLFLPVYLHRNVGPPSPQAAISPGPPAAALPRVLSTRLPVSTPPTSLDECFFFNSLVVGLPYIQFSVCSCCFLFLNLLLSFYWLCKEAQCVYLCLHLGLKS